MMTKKIQHKRCIIIAEAGVNHNGSFALAKKMIREAARADADYVKFQVFDPSALVTAMTPKARYQKKTTGAGEGQRKMLKTLCLSQAQFRLLKQECQRQGIGFLATAFDPDSLRFVESLRPDFHKISSGDIDNLPLLRQLARYGRPVILSTGMASMREIRLALSTLVSAGLTKRQVTILQCHTEYPTLPHEANLRVMDTFQRNLKVSSGLSDHTPGITVSLAAVARGACVIEKHFTLNRKWRGPDHAASLTPSDLHKMVQAIRMVEQALGDGIKQPTAREKRIKKLIRKQLVACRPVIRGEKFTPANLALKRAGGGLPASRWDEWIGKRARRDYQPEEKIQP